MPKPNQSITAREADICARVNIARKEIANLSQPELAQAMGITQNQLAGIEYKRAPLRYGHAKFLCETFNVSQRWLALGALPMTPRYNVPMQIYANYTRSALFSAAFEDLLDEPTVRIEAEWIKEFGEEKFRSGDFGELEFSLFEPLSAVYMDNGFRKFRKAFDFTFHWLPPELQVAYSDALCKAHDMFYAKFAQQLSAVLPPSERENFERISSPTKSRLTKVVSKDNITSVKAKLTGLLNRLNEATRERGTKTKLAKFMGADLPTVSRWLSGEKEPGGETTLRLLHWVEQQERQK